MEIKMQPERFSFQNKNVGEQIEDFKLMEEKLTIDEIIEHCKRQVDRLEKFCYKGEPGEMRNIDKEYWEHRQVKAYLEELKRYRELDKQGKMLILPCKPGDTVYLLAKDVQKPQIIHHKVKNLIYCVEIIPKIGKTVFLTEPEAEKALEGMKND